MSRRRTAASDGEGADVQRTKITGMISVRGTCSTLSSGLIRIRPKNRMPMVANSIIATTS